MSISSSPCNVSSIHLFSLLFQTPHGGLLPFIKATMDPRPIVFELPFQSEASQVGILMTNEGMWEEHFFLPFTFLCYLSGELGSFLFEICTCLRSKSL